MMQLTIGNSLVQFERVQTEPFNFFETCIEPNCLNRYAVTLRFHGSVVADCYWDPVALLQSPFPHESKLSKLSMHRIICLPSQVKSSIWRKGGIS